MARAKAAKLARKFFTFAFFESFARQNFLVGIG
jgi:hypothetical protein